MVFFLQKRNSSELLRLLLGTGRLIEAGSLALECLQAGKDQLSLKGLNMNPVCLPIRTIEFLRLELEKAIDNDEEYQKVRTCTSFVLVKKPICCVSVLVFNSLSFNTSKISCQIKYVFPVTSSCMKKFGILITPTLMMQVKHQKLFKKLLRRNWPQDMPEVGFSVDCSFM